MNKSSLGLLTLCLMTTLGLLSTGLLTTTVAGAQVTGTLGLDESRQPGLSADGKPLIYAPNPFEGGSSVSHWDVTASPNLLMEPSINLDLPNLEVDLTDEVFQDLGWSVAETLQAGQPLAKSASFNIWSSDTGFTDPTPFAGAPGNAATTLGEARLNVVGAVLARWGQILNSTVPIDVIVGWLPLPCDEQGAALAAAGPRFIIYSDTNELPLNSTWYHAAHAESLLLEDITGSPSDPNPGGDIVVSVNVDIDSGCLGAGTSFYYGLDGNAPANQIDLAIVILHELGHGLGFSTVTNAQNGVFNSGMPAAFDHFLYDLDLNKTWADMTTAERAASATSVDRLAWSGLEASTAAQDYLDPGVPALTLSGAGSLDGTYDVGTANFGAVVEDALSGEIACFEDGQGTPFDACSSATNGSELAGKIVLIDRGTCAFTVKAANAQAAGAAAVVIANNQGNALIQMTGDDPSITIPVVSVGQSVGSEIRAAACVDTNAVLLRNDQFQVSTDWNDGTTMTAAGPVKLTEDTAYFWFFNPDNVEVVVKVLDACAINNHFWVFASGLTNVGVELTITDLHSGQINNYGNTLNQDFVLIKDTEAFDCP